MDKEHQENNKKSIKDWLGPIGLFWLIVGCIIGLAAPHALETKVASTIIHAAASKFNLDLPDFSEETNMISAADFDASNNYYIRVASFQSKDNATNLTNIIYNSGYFPSVECREIQINNNKLYEVIVENNMNASIQTINQRLTYVNDCMQMILEGKYLEQTERGAIAIVTNAHLEGELSFTVK